MVASAVREALFLAQEMDSIDERRWVAPDLLFDPSDHEVWCLERLGDLLREIRKDLDADGKD